MHSMSDPVTLTVVLRPGSGAALPAGGLTAGTIAANAPDPEAAARVRSFFADRGFAVGPLVGIAFSITGPAAEVFGRVPEAGSLPLERLPEDVSEHLVAVEAESPLDFGGASGSF
jgi:hypothetical protein